MLKLVNLSKYYYSSNAVSLGLRKINLELKSGEFVAITGESGSGKTTLLSTISGMLSYEEGEMYFNGEPTSHYDDGDWEEYRKNHIAFVFQNYNLIDSYTALENVMTALLIQGETKESAKTKSYELLKQVGLFEYAKHRASQLSSGQKQRLSIARAMAKNTEIIVADEPTGNLDSENGQQIMQLFSRLAKDKLVIVVTHNFEEAKDFVTRKIKIFDGEIKEDIIYRPSDCVADNTNDISESVSEKMSKTAWLFTLMNIKSRPKRNLLLTVLLLVAAGAYFLFMGNFIANLDDTATKIYENDAFYNSDKTRIAVRHKDGTEITQADMEYFSSLKKVTYVEKYGVINDMYYFCENGTDYITTYAGLDVAEGEEPVYSEDIYLNSYTKFVRSASGLVEDDLVYGCLPRSLNEVVIYAEDASFLGKTITCYFNNKRDWQINSYIRMEMTVCGILKEETSQFYFSEELAKVLSINASGLVSVYNLGNGKNQLTVLYTDGSYGLEADEIMVSGDLYENNKDAERILLLIGSSDYERVISVIEIDNTDKDKPVVAGVHNSSKNFIMVSEEIFNELTAAIGSTQAGVFVEDYAYMDDTLDELRRAGYEAVCPFRVGSVEYDDAKVAERMVTLMLSLAAIIVLFVLEIIIVLAFLKNEKNNAVILKSIGMKQRMLERITFNTIICYGVTAFIVMLILVYAVSIAVPAVHTLIIYYHPYHILILFVLNMTAVFMAAGSYNRYLSRQVMAGREV